VLDLSAEALERYEASLAEQAAGPHEPALRPDPSDS